MFIRSRGLETLALPVKEFRYASNMKPDGSNLKRQLRVDSIRKSRRSASADSSLRAEIQRVEKMTMEERIRTALSLGKGFRGLEITIRDQ